MWLVRAALAQGTDPLVMAGGLWPKWRAWTIDLDRGVDDVRLARLVCQSGIDGPALRAATLLPIACAIGLTNATEIAIWPWVLALGSRNRKRRGGLQYCPICLASDARPYFRLQWRLAWHTCCADHGITLFDRCCHCQSPVEPNRLSVGTAISSCSTCNGDMRHATGLPAPKAALAFQQCADSVAVLGAGQYGRHRLSAKDWFLLARYFLMLLRCAARYRSSNLAKCLNSLDASVSKLQPPVTGQLGFEMLPAAERSKFLSCTVSLIQIGPELLEDAVVAAALSSASLRQEWRSLPQDIDEIVNRLPLVERSRKVVKNASGTPVSRRSVMYKWARLLRKMRQAL
jgi:hypothetical protein